MDIVHTHGLRALAVGLMASTHAAVVCTLHGFTEHDGHARRLAEVERRMARWASHTAAVSRPLAEDLLRRGHPGHRLCVVKNPVRLSPQGPRKAFQRGEPLRLIALSRLSPEKGLDIGIRAIAAQPAAELDIWGAGPQHDELSSLILALGVGARVRLRGQTDNVAGVLQGAHGLLLPSRREGEPLSLLEALASGLPVVASAVGGIPDAVEGTGAGRLVPPDDVDALADAIALLAEHHAEHARAAAAAAPRLMADRSPAAWAVRMDDVYRGALQERCTARRGFRATRPA